MCERPEEWRWSSHLATIGTAPPGTLALERLFGYLGETETEARARYFALVASDEDPAMPAHPLVVGVVGFVADHLRFVRPSPEYPKAALRATTRPLEELVQSTQDAAAITRAHVEHGYSMRAIASHLGCGVATIHRRDPKPGATESPKDGTWKT